MFWGDWNLCSLSAVAGLFVFCPLIYLIADRLVRFPYVGQLDTRYILITGCDSGFGREAAQRLDKLGCHVFAGCLTEKGETELQKTCSTRLIPVHLDVTDSHSILEAFNSIKAYLPRDHGLWAVLNNAGINCSHAPMEWLQLSDYQRVLDVNLLGMVSVTTTFLPLLKKARGRVVNTSSLAGRLSLPKLGPYCISKYGVEAFSDSLRLQLKSFNVSVHIVEPSGYMTNIVEREAVTRDLQQKWNALSPELRKEYGEEYLHGCFERLDQMVAPYNNNLKPVIDAYCHSVLGKYPRARYVPADRTGALIVAFHTLAPEWLADIAVLKSPGIGDPVPPAACVK